MGLLVLAMGALLPRWTGVPSHAAIRAEANRPPDIPYRVAMREAALSWTAAVQLADDEQDAARGALRDWDPAAPFDSDQTRRQFLRADDGGYVRQAMAAIRRAARLARSPRERWRTEARRQQWQGALQTLTISSHLAGTVESDGD